MDTRQQDARDPFLPEIQIEGPAAQRRWTVLLRLILVIPHVIVLYFVGIAACVVAILGWFAALFTARLPSWIADFLSMYVGYRTRVDAYFTLLVDRFPPFLTTTLDYPVRVDIQPRGLNRAAVLFRIVLVIPAVVMTAILANGWVVLGFFLWLSTLIAGRVPRPVFGATAAFVRYAFRTQAYFLMLTGAYPKRLFGDGGTPEEGLRATGTRPLVLSQGARVLLIVFIVLGVLALVSGSATNAYYGPGPGHYEYDYGLTGG